MRLHLSIAFGGMLGALSRHAVGEWVTGWAGHGFPWGTLLINGGGSLLLGFLTRVLPATLISRETRAMLTIGLCGGFTTFSTFAYETFDLLAGGQVLVAGIYMGSTITFGLFGALVGAWAGSAALRPRR